MSGGEWAYNDQSKAYEITLDNTCFDIKDAQAGTVVLNATGKGKIEALKMTVGNIPASKTVTVSGTPVNNASSVVTMAFNAQDAVSAVEDVAVFKDVEIVATGVAANTLAAGLTFTVDITAAIN